MRGLRGITILLALGSGQALSLGAPPEPAAPPAAQTEEKPQGKPTALEFVKAGAYLYNKGQVDKASNYFKAADRVRGQLTANEEIVLEVYLEEVENYYKKLKTPPVPPRVDAAVAPASSTALAPPSLETTKVPEPAAAPGGPASMPSLGTLRQPSRFETTDPKQIARWRLQESREQMALGNFDAAARKIAEAKAMDVKWHFLEDTPDKMAKLLKKVQAKNPNGLAAPSVRPLGVRVPESGSPQPAGTPPTGGVPTPKL